MFAFACFRIEMVESCIVTACPYGIVFGVFDGQEARLMIHEYIFQLTIRLEATQRIVERYPKEPVLVEVCSKH